MKSVLSVVLAAALVLASTGRAAVIIVDTTADDTIVNGNCTLREAMMAANTNASVDACSDGDASLDSVIIFASGTISLTGGPLPITGTVSILGPGESSLVIDGGNQRIFDIAMNNAAYDATIQQVTLRNGAAGAEDGGAVRIGLADAVTFRQVVFDSNTAMNGGAIGFSDTDMCNTLSITRCIFIDNFASSLGGAFALLTNSNNAVRPFDAIEISDTQFTGNSSGSSGGSMFAAVKGGFILDRCSFVGNTAQGNNGGAIYMTGPAATGPKLVVKNSFFAANQAPGSGGAVFLWAMGLQLVHTTMVRNVALGDSNPATLWVVPMSGAVKTVSHSVIADTLVGSDCYMGAVESLGYNLDSDGSCPFTLGSDLQNADPQVGGVLDPGGWTLTAAPSLHSPMIDSGFPTGALDENGSVIVVDQLSNPRPVDGDGDAGAYCDRGSIEVPDSWDGLFTDSFEEGSAAAWSGP